MPGPEKLSQKRTEDRGRVIRCGPDCRSPMIAPRSSSSGTSGARRSSSRRSTQSALGNGAGYMALLLIAYIAIRVAVGHQPGAAGGSACRPCCSGPVFGAVADRFSRRACVVAADVVQSRSLHGHSAGRQLRGHRRARRHRGDGHRAVHAGGPGVHCRAWSNGGACRRRRRFTARSRTWASRRDPRSPVRCCCSGERKRSWRSTARPSRSRRSCSPFSGSGRPRHRVGRRAGGSILRAAAERVPVGSRASGCPRRFCVASSLAFFFVGLFNVAELLFAREVLGTSERRVLATGRGVRRRLHRGLAGGGRGRGVARAQAPLPARAGPDGGGLPGLRARALGRHRRRSVPRRRLRQRAGPGLRAADDSGHGLRCACRTSIRRSRTPWPPGRSGSRFSWPAG